MRLVHTWKGDFLCEQFSRLTVYKIVEPLELTYDSFELLDSSFLLSDNCRTGGTPWGGWVDL
jgi:hypothetical protein